MSKRKLLQGIYARSRAERPKLSLKVVASCYVRTYLRTRLCATNERNPCMPQIVGPVCPTLFRPDSAGALRAHSSSFLPPVGVATTSSSSPQGSNFLRHQPRPWPNSSETLLAAPNPRRLPLPQAPTQVSFPLFLPIPRVVVVAVVVWCRCDARKCSSDSIMGIETDAQIPQISQTSLKLPAPSRYLNQPMLPSPPPFPPLRPLPSLSGTTSMSVTPSPSLRPRESSW